MMWFLLLPAMVFLGAVYWLIAGARQEMQLGSQRSSEAVRVRSFLTKLGWFYVAAAHAQAFEPLWNANRLSNWLVVAFGWLAAGLLLWGRMETAATEAVSLLSWLLGIRPRPLMFQWKVARPAFKEPVGTVGAAVRGTCAGLLFAGASAFWVLIPKLPMLVSGDVPITRYWMLYWFVGASSVGVAVVLTAWLIWRRPSEGEPVCTEHGHVPANEGASIYGPGA